MQMQKATRPPAKATVCRSQNGFPSNIRATRPFLVMHAVQGCFARAALVMQLQHDYMAVQKQQCFNHEQFIKDYPHGRL